MSEKKKLLRFLETFDKSYYLCTRKQGWFRSSAG